MRIVRLLRRTVLVLVGAAVVAYAVFVIRKVQSSSNQVNTAAVYTGYLTVLLLVVAVPPLLIGWWGKSRAETADHAVTSVRLDAAADRLANQMMDRWRQEASQRRIITPAPATVRWRWAAEEIAPRRVEVASPPVPGTGPPPLPELGEPGELLQSGVVTHLHDEMYAKLPHGRLILIGGPGAGKTAAMILLLLAALARRASLDSDRRSRVPVPAWLTLSTWNSATTTLYEWAIATINRDHPALLAPDYGPDAAGELLRSGRVALFLDGLDELPKQLRAQALQRLNGEARGLRVVITSRPEEYEDTLEMSSLENTAVIELRPVGPADAAAYLLHGQTGVSRQRWEQVGTYLKYHPESTAAMAMNNPLNLSLARDTYLGQSPTELTDSQKFATVEAIHENLVDRVLITAYPDERQRTQVTQWLSWVAQHMGTSRELPWWDIPTWVPPWQLRLVRGLAVGIAAGLGIGLGIAEPGPEVQSSALAIGFGAGGFAGIIAAIVIGGRSGFRFGLSREPHTLVPHWPRAAELRQALWAGLKTALAVGLVAGLTVGFTGVFSGDIAGGVSFGLLFGLLTGLAVGFIATVLNVWVTPIASSPSATPADTYRADSRTSLLYGLAIGIFFAASFAYPYRPRDILYSPATLLIGLGFGLAVGQVPEVKFTELVLAFQHILTGHGRSRARFRRLLEDAYNRQLLRQAGAFYQFRHAALQDRLATMYTSPSDTPVKMKASRDVLPSAHS
jgi:hypothetical protein